MIDDEENNLDHRFKEGLSNAEDNIAFRNADWDAMEKLLDEKKRRKGFIFRLPVIISGIAAMLLMALGFFFLRTGNKPGANKNDVANVKPAHPNSLNNTTDTAISNGTNLANNNPNTIDKTSTYKNPSKGNSAARGTLKNQPIVKNSTELVAGLNTKPHKKVTGKTNGVVKNSDIESGISNDGKLVYQHNGSKTDILNTTDETAIKNSNADLANASGTAVLSIDTGLAVANLSATDKQLNNSSNRYVAAVKQKQKAAISATGNPHNVILSILTAPDVNGVGSSFSQGQLGTTSGLMLSVGLTHRLTVSMGAMYSKKPYMASFSQYNTTFQFKDNPTNVYADCRVLDIPINIDYRLYSKGRNLFAVGTGISSYFMLRENYHFDYTGTPGPSDYNISNQNQHIFGVLNINATYQRRINEKFGLNVQPYMKLPLTNIGYGKVDLQSTGVAVGVSWYLSSSRPK
ncbi:hypothetical protein [Mucilaginibacter polytrichastri]|uniref:Outer membrane protein beta-barrel domain-containing protein n=1 Tax=Mucilaginibacter polytrichastri TaxID=1302689 RepID=A0A1Q5ZZG7_9SPHI|nr:hypothetical protein [Mucilaginibacter polytrichastri]OKS87164.1 hypothetical protein RG47T_2623 [Mucilaginibacter polytrichastri]SFS88290.1 hypothetical protein SAMN04487890_105229 [Mucilaginibacter polytrichastri]